MKSSLDDSELLQGCESLRTLCSKLNKGGGVGGVTNCPSLTRLTIFRGKMGEDKHDGDRKCSKIGYTNPIHNEVI